MGLEAVDYKHSPLYNAYPSNTVYLHLILQDVVKAKATA
jgi:hypothetical protein